MTWSSQPAPSNAEFEIFVTDEFLINEKSEIEEQFLNASTPIVSVDVCKSTDESFSQPLKEAFGSCFKPITVPAVD